MKIIVIRVKTEMGQPCTLKNKNRNDWPIVKWDVVLSKPFRFKFNTIPGKAEFSWKPALGNCDVGIYNARNKLMFHLSNAVINKTVFLFIESRFHRPLT